MLSLYIILGLLLVVCLANWRRGVFICVLIGFLQDPIRKISPDQTVYFTVLVVPYVLTTLVGMLLSEKKLKRIFSWYPRLKIPLWLFMSMVVIQAARGLITSGNIVVFGIGLLGYLSPTFTALLAFNYPMKRGDIERFIKLYTLVGTVFVSGVFAEALGFDWAILGNVGVKLYFYPDVPRVLHAGILRSPEISAWHGAMVVMLGIISFALSPPRLRKYIWLIFSGIVIVAVILTGRRKALATMVLFILIVLAFAFYSRSRSFKVYMSSIILGSIFLLGVFQIITFESIFSAFDVYKDRLSSNTTSRLETAWNMVFSAPKWVIRHNSLWGAGAGTGSQGAQHFGGVHTGMAAEGGIAKILAELGIIGFAAFTYLVVRLGKYFWKVIRYMRHDKFYGSLSIGLVAILVANGINFSVAHQAFGDPFVLLLLGFLMGFILALPPLFKQEFLVNQQITDSNRPAPKARHPLIRRSRTHHIRR